MGLVVGIGRNCGTFVEGRAVCRIDGVLGMVSKSGLLGLVISLVRRGRGRLLGRMLVSRLRLGGVCWRWHRGMDLVQRCIAIDE